MSSVAEKVFRQVGESLKRRREKDVILCTGSHLTDRVLSKSKLDTSQDLDSSQLTDQSAKDPALYSSELKLSLEKNKKMGEAKLQSLFEEFSARQVEMVAQKSPKKEVKEEEENEDADADGEECSYDEASDEEEEDDENQSKTSSSKSGVSDSKEIDAEKKESEGEEEEEQMQTSSDASSSSSKSDEAPPSKKRRRTSSSDESEAKKRVTLWRMTDGVQPSEAKPEAEKVEQGPEKAKAGTEKCDEEASGKESDEELQILKVTHLKFASKVSCCS